MRHVRADHFHKVRVDVNEHVDHVQLVELTPGKVNARLEEVSRALGLQDRHNSTRSRNVWRSDAVSRILSDPWFENDAALTDVDLKYLHMVWISSNKPI